MKRNAARNNRHHSERTIGAICDQAAPVALPPALATIAAGRDHILTGEFAKATNRASQTLRKNYCKQGECYGIRPLKVGNRLLWPVNQLAALLNGGPPSKAA